MHLVWLRIISEAIEIVGTGLATLLMRWLLELSTPQKDIAWLKRQHWYSYLERLQFYRGLEYYRQLQFFRIVNGL